jgi:hypothetical protein
VLKRSAIQEASKELDRGCLILIIQDKFFPCVHRDLTRSGIFRPQTRRVCEIGVFKTRDCWWEIRGKLNRYAVSKTECCSFLETIKKVTQRLYSTINFRFLIYKLCSQHDYFTNTPCLRGLKVPLQQSWTNNWWIFYKLVTGTPYWVIFSRHR